jgi:hypothetical protein
MLFMTCGDGKETNAIKELTKIHDLPEILAENSGMIAFDNLFWMINDGGNDAALFGYNNLLGTIDRKLVVRDAVNTDWEEITQNNAFAFVGDFGNNQGNRTDLRIYILNKEDFQASDTIAVAGVIAFNYEDQTDFAPGINNTSFDCEAFIPVGDSLYLFTKDWITEHTKIYALPAKAGTYVAKPVGQLDVSGLVTAAVFSAEDDQLVLLGYRDYIPFIWIIPGFDVLQPTMNNAVRSDFSEHFAVQVEGILIEPNGEIYVSSEETALAPAALFRAVR